MEIRNKVRNELKKHVEIDDKGEIEYALDTKIECDRERCVTHITGKVFA